MFCQHFLLCHDDTVVTRYPTSVEKSKDIPFPDPFSFLDADRLKVKRSDRTTAVLVV